MLATHLRVILMCFMFQRGLIPRAKETLVTLILLSGVVLGITFVLSAILDRDQGAITQLYSKYYV
jgi:hypothetical protein